MAPILLSFVARPGPTPMSPSSLLLLIVSAASNPSTGTRPASSLDAIPIDPDAKPQPLEAFENVDDMSVREIVSRLGPPSQGHASGSRRWMQWRLPDGRQFTILAADLWGTPGIAQFRGVTPGASEPGSPARVVRDFYRWNLTPTYQEMAGPVLAPARKWLGSRFMLALEAQEEFEQACARAAPRDYKPHMIEGNVFNRYIDGIDRVESIEQTIMANVARVDIVMSGDSYEKVDRWNQQVWLVKEDHRWVIVDVRWEDGGVISNLQDFAAQRCW